MAKLIAGNWKMNGTLGAADAFAASLRERLAGARQGLPDILVCPPATLLVRLVERFAGTAVALGAQDCHAAPAGAHTGDIAAPLLADAGARYVIVGHSERRAGHGESDAMVAAKATAVLAAGMSVIVCVGESKLERDAGRTLGVVERQLEGSLPAADAIAAATGRLVVAYEPVWAIGSGATPSADEIVAVHEHLARRLATRIPGGPVPVLYGGSVKAANAAEILGLPGVGGGLIGGASLAADEFWRIIAAAA
jgi:triosephosphate isomerase